MDASMFVEKSTYIPGWVIDNLWEIREVFPHSSKKNQQSEVDILYNNPGAKKSLHEGWVTTTRYDGKRNDIMRFHVDDDVERLLKRDFPLTHRRMLEKISRGWNSPKAERAFPFWEFVDIEFDADEFTFILTPHYNLPESMMARFPEMEGEEISKPDARETAVDISEEKEVVQPKYIAWMVLQNPDSSYADVEAECYEYPRSIPNGARIDVGDYLICTLAKKNSEGGKRIFGIGRIETISEYVVEGKIMRKAIYDWYRSFSEPKTFKLIGGDPRNNIYNAINSIPESRVNDVVNILV